MFVCIVHQPMLACLRVSQRLMIHAAMQAKSHCAQHGVFVHVDCKHLVRAESGDAPEPLLHEPAASDIDSDSDSDTSDEFSSQKDGRRTIMALLGIIAADTPLLLVAFAAGRLWHHIFLMSQSHLYTIQPHVSECMSHSLWLYSHVYLHSSHERDRHTRSTTSHRQSIMC